MGVIDGRTWKKLTALCPDLPDRIRADIKPRFRSVGQLECVDYYHNASITKMLLTNSTKNETNDQTTKFVEYEIIN